MLPAAPGNVQVNTKTAVNISLLWNATSGASYNLYRSDSVDGTYNKLCAIGDKVGWKIM